MRWQRSERKSRYVSKQRIAPFDDNHGEGATTGHALNIYVPTMLPPRWW